MQFPRYDSYKSSGVEWLGEMPTGWKTTKIKWLAKIINGATPPSTNPKFWEGDVCWYK